MNELFHKGVAHDENPPGRGSGRYAYGTGENPGQHQFTIISETARLKKHGISESEIAKMLLGPRAKATDLKAELSIAKSEQRKFNHQRAVQLLDECKGNKSEVARRMGVNESVIRSYLKQIEDGRDSKYQNTADFLKSKVDELGMINVSSSTEFFIGVPDNTKKVAIKILEKQGYVRGQVKIEQLGTGKETLVTVLAPPGTTWKDIQKNKYDIKSIQEFSPDNGNTFWVPEHPTSMSSKRVMVRYAEDGGKDMDGVIQIRRGVEDLSLGKSQYAQVRIAVDDTHYMKGMAIYADDKEFPKGMDVIYNSNKTKDVPMIGSDKNHEVLKRLKSDPDNVFGATIKAGGQYHYKDKDGKDHLSPINKLQEEGDWDTWSRNLSSQFLSKQSIELINQQLNFSIAKKKVELETIQNLTNPVIKQKLLDQFASGCDANASDLSAKGFKGQAFQVILPVPKMKPTEIYAPNYKDGEEVALVRYPHGGIFEIPILKVNNRNNPQAESFMKMAKDAVGIHPQVAEQLSGADFDGDTALVIPITRNKIKIKSKPPIKDLQEFDGKLLYKLPDGSPEMKDRTKQRQMGEVSNLITDMTVGGAGESEIVRAVKHSMVVIDAQKHHLDYKKSADDFDIVSLKAAYQGVNEKGGVKGASTILSRAGSEAHPYQLKEVTDIKKMTPEEVRRWNNGEVIYHETGKTKVKWKEVTNPKKMTPEELENYKSGKKVFRNQGEERVTQKIEQMYLVRDARDLVRDKNNEKEMAYANYANELKSLANQARKESRSIKPIPVNKSAKAAYAEEVRDLEHQLVLARMNQPRETQAQILAGAIVSEKKKSNPELANDYEHLKREKNRALNEARAIVGAKKRLIDISDRQWEAIQANAISTNKLKQILDNTDQEAFKKRATPREMPKALTSAQIALIKSMYSSGMYTQADIAQALGVSTSTVSNAI